MEPNSKKQGLMFWTDLTVDEPQIVLDFYKTLFNWSSFEVPMKDEEEAYVDYGMSIDEQTPGGGICHNRGKNKGIPPQWITYFYVPDVANSIAQCLSMGGKLIKESKKKDGTYIYAILQDPIGAVFGVGTM